MNKKNKKQKLKKDMTKAELEQKLNDNQLAFIQEYLVNGKNATEAYLNVYDNVTYDSARVLASNFLKQEHVQNYIRFIRDETIENYKIDRNFIIDEYIELIESAKRDERIDRANWNKALVNLTELLGLKEQEVINLKHTIEKININIKKKK